MPSPLVGTGDDFHPVTRLAGFLRNPKNAMAFYRMVAKAGRVESADLSERSLLISIETFREPHSIDVEDVRRCSRFYLDDGQVHQACIFNTLIRPGKGEND